MSHFSLELPTIQNWNCHSCSECCKQHGIFVTDEDKARIEKQQYALRDSIRLLVSVLKNPRALGNPELIDDALRMLKNWDRD